MKTIYINDLYYQITLKDNTSIRSYSCGTPMYQYGELPEVNKKEYSGEDVFYDLANKLHDNILKNLITGREYIYNYIFDRKIYKDEVKSFEEINCYKKVDKPKISKLQNDLGFYKYSELVFDREMELKNMLIQRQK